jgi:hypothetical protein
VELAERPGDARLVRDNDHAHPAAEQAQRVDTVERLRPRRYLHHDQRLALGLPHPTHRQRQMIDMRFHHAGDLTVAFEAE